MHISPMYGELEKSNFNSIESIFWILHQNFSAKSESVKKLLKMSKKNNTFYFGPKLKN